jgi:hypothetical protein
MLKYESILRGLKILVMNTFKTMTNPIESRFVTIKTGFVIIFGGKPARVVSLLSHFVLR